MQIRMKYLNLFAKLQDFGRGSLKKHILPKLLPVNLLNFKKLELQVERRLMIAVTEYKYTAPAPSQAACIYTGLNVEVSCPLMILDVWEAGKVRDLCRAYYP